MCVPAWFWRAYRNTFSAFGLQKPGPEQACAKLLNPVRNPEHGIRNQSGTVQNYQNREETWSNINFFFTLVIFGFNVENSLLFTFFITVPIENIMITLDGGDFMMTKSFIESRFYP